MRTEQRTVYIADDGTEFATEREARTHDQVEPIAQFIWEEGRHVSREDARDAATVLLSGYRCIPLLEARRLSENLARVAQFLTDSARPSQEVLDIVGDVRDALNNVST